MPFALDLDGVVWLADQPIPGSADAVARLRAAGESVLFCTNYSVLPVAEVEAKLAHQGIPADGDVVTAAMAGALLVEPGERVLICGGPGVTEAVLSRGAIPVRDGPADAVLVGMHQDFDYQRLTAASQAVQAGARLLATNDDPTYPTGHGLLPGAGAIVAAVERAAGVTAIVAGKPNQPMADLVLARLGPTGTMVGDRPDTDGRFAAALGYRFALVLSGVAESAAEADPAPAVVGPDLAHLVEVLLRSR